MFRPGRLQDGTSILEHATHRSDRRGLRKYSTADSPGGDQQCAAALGWGCHARVAVQWWCRFDDCSLRTHGVGRAQPAYLFIRLRSQWPEIHGGSRGSVSACTTLRRQTRRTVDRYDTRCTARSSEASTGTRRAFPHPQRLLQVSSARSRAKQRCASVFDWKWQCLFFRASAAGLSQQAAQSCG